MGQLACPDCNTTLFLTEEKEPDKAPVYHKECMKCGYRGEADAEDMESL